MNDRYKKQLEIIQEEILRNIKEIQQLVKRTEELHDFAETSSLKPEQKSFIENQIKGYRDIIKKLTDQTLEMFSAFKKFVK